MDYTQGTTYRQRYAEAKGGEPWTWVDAVEFVCALIVIAVMVYVSLYFFSIIK